MASIINAATSGGLISTADTSGILQLQTAGTTAVTVGASQNVGVGTASPTKKLDILSNTSQDGIRISGSANPRLTIIDTTTPVQFDALCTDTEAVLRTDTNHPLVLSTNGTERARIPAAGGVQAVTTISVGNATPSSSGAGITFPATQSASSDANTLDDYEEGTWTPTLGGTSTYTKQVGEYVKVGQSVIYAGAMSVGLIGTGSATGAISGLPFTASNIDVNRGKAGSVCFFDTLAVSIASLGIYINNAGTTLQTTTVAAGGATATGTASIFQNSSKIDFAGSYKSSS